MDTSAASLVKPVTHRPRLSSDLQWLHYLAIKLLHHKGLRKPVAPRGTGKGTCPSSPNSAALADVSPEKRCYESLMDVEALLSQAVKAYTKSLTNKSGAPRRKTAVAATSTVSLAETRQAADVVAYGISRGWIS